MKACLIGGRVGASLSPLIHSLMGVEYTHERIECGALGDFVKSAGVDGFNVTMPFKKQIIPYLDEVSDIAKLCNAVNTVYFSHGKSYGFNTDLLGMKYMAKRSGVDLKDKEVLILGGGATKDTAVYFAESCGAKSVNFVSRTGVINYSNCYALEDTEVIINATPVGSVGFEPSEIIDPTAFKRLYAVLDCVYNPFRSRLVQTAERLGLKASGGLPMLVEQALSSEDIWLNRTHTRSLTDKILSIVKGKTLNIVLIGMPSCGKSVIGKALAEKTGRTLYDTDEEIERAAGKSCAEIIRSQGEKAFRELEKKVVKDLECVRGAIIATGGGTVLDRDNVTSLKGNGFVVGIDRDIALLTAEGRPLSAESIEKLYERRKDVYKRAADFIVVNDMTAAECADRIISAYEDFCNKRT